MSYDGGATGHLDMPLGPPTADSLREVLRTSPAAALVLDVAQGTLQVISPAGRRLLDRAGTEPLSRWLHDIALGTQCRNEVAVLRTWRPQTDPVSLDGGPAAVAVSCLPIRYRGRDCVMLVLHELSAAMLPATGQATPKPAHPSGPLPTALPSTALPSPALPSPVLPSPALPSPALPGPALPATASPGTALPAAGAPTPTLPVPPLPVPALPVPAQPSAGMDDDLPASGEQATTAAADRNCAVFTLDVLGRVDSWTAAAQRITGYPVEEVIGSDTGLFHPATDRAAGAAHQALTRAYQVGEHRVEGWRQRADGSLLWVEATTVALRDLDGRLTGFGVLWRDLTRAHRLHGQPPGHSGPARRTRPGRPASLVPAQRLAPLG